MLLSFRFANHRSFRDEQQLNLTPVYPSGGSSEPAVRVVGIFGANASGKSNCLHALSFMRHFALFSDRDVEPGLGVAREPFRLTPESLEGPSHYVVDLSLNGIRHTYGFALDNDGVLDEWLYHYPHKRRRRIFERTGESFAWGEESGRRNLLERIAEVTAPTALFLSTVARFGHAHEPGEPEDEPLHDVYRWFLGIYNRKNPNYRQSTTVVPVWPESDAGRRTVVELVRAADVGIIDVIAVTSAVTDEPPESLRSTATRTSQSRMPRNARNRGSRQRRLKFAHQGADGDVLFELDEESTGTQQLLGLAIEAAEALGEGGTMCVDEIDASLHPLLTAKLVGLFQSAASNPRHSQLIFTSHDAALLGTIDTEEILRRDEIWFTEKDDEGASKLYPMTDFKPRKEGENRQRRYLNGNYGAVPDLSTYLFEQALAARGQVDDEATS